MTSLRHTAVISTASLLCGLALQGASLTDGLLVYLPFSGSGYDETGLGHEAILNTVEFGVDRFGVADRAVVFKGGEMDFAQIIGSEEIQPASYSISLWFKTSTVDGSPRFLIAKAGAECEIHFGEGGDRLYGLRFIPVTQPGSAIDSPVNVFAHDQWTHIVCVAGEGSGGQKIYINGVDVGGTIIGATIDFPMMISDFPILLGRRYNNIPGYRFIGSMDDVRIYDRVLSSAEIQTLYLTELQAPYPLQQFTIISATLQYADTAGTDQYSLQAGFTLGAGSTGYDPLADETQVTFGTTSITIPAGYLSKKGSSDYVFSGNIGSTPVKVTITQITATDFSIKAQVSKLDLSGSRNPVKVRLTAGRNVGSAELRLKGRLTFGL